MTQHHHQQQHQRIQRLTVLLFICSIAVVSGLTTLSLSSIVTSHNHNNCCHVSSSSSSSSSSIPSSHMMVLSMISHVRNSHHHYHPNFGKRMVAGRQCRFYTPLLYDQKTLVQLQLPLDGCCGAWNILTSPRQRQLRLHISDDTNNENDDQKIMTAVTVINNNDNEEYCNTLLSSLSDETNVPVSTTNNETTTGIISNTWIWKFVLPLWLVYISNQWSRSSIYYLVNFDTTSSSSSLSSSVTTLATTTTTTTTQLPIITAMNIEIGFDETQYGILASLAFTSLFAITSLGAGLLSDRYNRKILTIISVIGWTIATYGTAISTSYESIVLWRIAMGFACAFSTPTAYTLLRDHVPTTRQATASSLYGTGVALGSGLASYTLVLDNMYGWRQALDIIAAAGLVATLVTVILLPDDNTNIKTLPNPTPVVLDEISTALPKASSLINDKDDQIKEETSLVESIINDVQMSFATDRAKWIYLGSFVRFCSGLCIGVWGAPYFRMTFSDHVNDYAYTQAAISAIGATFSGIVGGAIADQLSSSTTSSATTNNEPDKNQGNISSAADDDDDDDLIGRRLWVPVIGSLLAAPAWYMAIHSPDSFEVSMAWLATEYIVAECWFGPTISTLQTTVGAKIGGTAQGLFTLTGAIANVAPSILGYLYGQTISSSGNVDGDVVAGAAAGASSSSLELANLLTLAVCFGYVANAFCFSMAANARPQPWNNNNNNNNVLLRQKDQ